MTPGRPSLVLKKLTPDFVRNKRVLLKVDYNVPLEKEGSTMRVVDDARVRATLPTLEFLLKNDAKIVITSHLGRPNGKTVEAMRLAPVAKHVEKLLNHPVATVEVPAGPPAEAAVAAMKPGDILMLENSRFDPGEKSNDPQFAQALASLADVYVNDAFASSHRAHASVSGVMKLLPAVAGLALEQEVTMLGSLMEHPQRPFVAIVGGAKISDKVEAIRSLSKIADVVLVGGGVANNFLKADGLEVFHSYLEDVPEDQKKENVSFVAVAETLMKETKRDKMMLHGYIPLPKILYPSDVVAAESLDKPGPTKVLDLTNGDVDDETQQWMYLDIGPKTQQLYSEIIKQAKTIFWNGPMGVFEQAPFAAGTKAVAEAVANSVATTVAGGGDTIRALHEFQVAQKIGYISGAGGAALEFLSGATLPGIEPLLEKNT